MSIFSNTQEMSIRYETYVERLHELFRGYGVSFGRPTDFPQLAQKLVRVDGLRMDFSMLTRWMQEREEGRLTLDQMLTIIGIAMSGPKATSLQPSSTAPLTAFLSSLGGWSVTEAEPETSIPPPVPKSSETGTRSGVKGSDDLADEKRQARERLNAEIAGGPRGNTGSESLGGPGSPRARAGAMFTGPAPMKPMEETPSRLDQDMELPKPPPANLEQRLERIRQQLDELDGRTNSTTDTSTPTTDATTSKQGEIKTVESPAPQSSIWSFVGSATTAPQIAQADIFRADTFKAAQADILKAAIKHETKPANVSRLAEIAGVPTTQDMRRHLIVAALVFLVLLPPAVVCVLLYRDSIRTVNKAPSVTESDGVGRAGSGGRMRRARPRGQPRVGNKGENAVSGMYDRGNAALDSEPRVVVIEKTGETHIEVLPQSEAIPSIEAAPTKIYPAKPGTPPLIAGTGPGVLAGTAEGKMGPGSWSALLRETDPITGLRQPEFPLLETTPVKIPPAKPETLPMVAGMESKMPAVVPKEVVEMSFPVVIVRADPSPSPTGAKMPALVNVARAEGGSGGSGGSTLGRGVSSVRPFELLHPSVAVSAGLLNSNIVKFQMPSYPKAARKQRLEGDVLVRILISEKGKIERAVALNGPPTLRGAVEKAVHHWRYKPYMQNGKPVEVQTWVTFHFVMREG